MVDNTLEKAIQKELLVDITEEVLNWSSVSLSEIRDEDWRLEARYFNIEGKHAREILRKCKWSVVDLWSDNGFIEHAQYPGRFKRVYVEKGGIPFLLPFQINEIYPKPTKFISEKTAVDIDDLRVKKGNILLTRSGTTGNITLVSRTFDGMVFSDDVIRIEVADSANVGYVYAFLRSRIGQTLITTNNYGAVIPHIEPEHLKYIPIPNPEKEIKGKINDLVQESFELRDLSNELIGQGQKFLVSELKLPPIEELYPLSDFDFNHYEVKLSALDERFDASYHETIIGNILRHIKIHAGEVTVLGDDRISKRIVLPGRFKRVYVAEGQGTRFLGGRDILQLDPDSRKYISNVQHGTKIAEELIITGNDLIFPSRGTLGKVVLTPKHFEGWAISDNLIKLLPSNTDLIGYVFAFLDTEYGKALIRRFKYGGVIDALEVEHISRIPIPLLKSQDTQRKINNLVLEANRKQYEAYVLEQEALKLVNDLVIYAR